MSIDPNKKVAGLLVPVFALRGSGDLGIGDTRAFGEAIDFCHENKLSILQTLPINETSGDNSPYNSISSMALEPALLSMEPESVPGLTESIKRSVCERICDREKNGSNLETLISRMSVDYKLVKLLKLSILKESYLNFKSILQNQTSTSGQEQNKNWQKLESNWRRFERDNRDWLRSYVLFRAIVEELAGNCKWTEWPDHFRNPQLAMESFNSEERLSVMDFFSYVQWVADEQWKSLKSKADKLGVRLMGDVPFGVSKYSADVWSDQGLFDLEWSGGAPPEPVFHGDLFTKRWGQNWGVPLYKWQAHKKDGFSWWKKRVKRALDYFHDYRIDHVLGFFRIYSFPWEPERNWEFLELDDKEASLRTGGLLPGFRPREDEPESNAALNQKEGEEILSAIVSVSGNSWIVAEDLGLIIPKYLRPTLKKLGMAGFAIPLFERDEKTRDFKTAESLEPLSLATYATHDHEPLLSYYRNLVEGWLGPDGHESWLELQRLMKFLGLDEEAPPKEFTLELHEAFVEKLLSTPCWASVFMVSDMLGTDHRFNQPGLSGEECWTRRLEMTLSQFQEHPDYAPRIRRLRESIENFKRNPELEVVIGS